RVNIPLQDPRLFTGEAEWQEFIRTDELGLRQATLSFLRAGLELDRMVESAPARLRQPLLLMLAGRDEIIDNAALRRWSDLLAAEQRTLVEYSDAAHTLEFEPHREQFVTDLIDWLGALRTSVEFRI